jgi:hypothetical protein
MVIPTGGPGREITAEKQRNHSRSMAPVVKLET